MNQDQQRKNILALFGQHTIQAYISHEAGLYAPSQKYRINRRAFRALALSGVALVVVASILSAVAIQSFSKPVAKKTNVAVNKSTVQTVIQKPTTPSPQQVTTPAPTTPAPIPKPAPTPPPPPPPPSLPVVAGKNTSYNLGVLVIKYFPLTSDGQNINIAVTGDVGDPYPSIRQHTIDVTNNLANSVLPRASTYLRYKYGGDGPSLSYHIVATFEHTVAAPINSTIHPGYPTYPDYYGIMTSHNICSYVDGQGVHEVWLWAYQGPSTQGPNHDQPYLAIEESKMSGPYGDISNSYRWNDMPHCNHTYVVYTFNYGRGTSEATESWGHQMEAEIDAVNTTLFRSKFQGPNYPQTLGVTGRCGSVHNPPNARWEYDRDNPTPQLSDCLDWNPDGMGTLSSISCANWGCQDISDANNSSLNYMIWMWENLPGMNNTKTYQGKQLRNWWDVHGEFDTVMGSSKYLTLP